MKVELKNDLLLYPCPVLLVTSKLDNIENVFTVSWSGIASSHPEYVTISIKPSRYSHSIIKKSGLFTINIINKDLLKVADYCGSVSGKTHNKFSECGLQKSPGHLIDVPILEECPINIECKVEKIIELGSHDLFVGKVVSKLINSNISITNLHDELDAVAYFRPNYYTIDNNCIGTYGQYFELSMLKDK